MFLFSKKLKTPVSTYTDSYRPPCSVRKTMKSQEMMKSMQEMGENRFITQGLWSPPPQVPAIQGQPEHLIKSVTQDYYRNSIDNSAFCPDSRWLPQSEERYKPLFVNDHKYITWRTGPYNTAAWNKHSCYLPFLPKETRMDTFLHSIPVLYPPKPRYLNQYERGAVTSVLHRLSQCAPPSLQPVYTLTGRGTFEGYYSPCSGRHYFLQGIDYHPDGIPAIRTHLHSLGDKAEYAVLWLQPQSDLLYLYRLHPTSSLREP